MTGRLESNMLKILLEMLSGNSLIFYQLRSSVFHYAPRLATFLKEHFNQ